MAYLPPDARQGRGTKLARRVLRRALPGDRRGRRRDAAVRPRERPDPELTPREHPRLRQARARDRRPDRPHRRRPGHRHPVPRLHGQPARGVRGRGGGPDRRGPGRLDDRPDPRARPRPRSSSATRWRSGSTGRSCSRPTARDWDPVATAGAIVDAIRAQEAADGPFDLILFGNESADSGGFQVGIRVAAGARPADRHRGQGARGRRRRGDRPARGGRRRLGGLRAAAAGGRRRQGGDQPAALPVGAGPAPGAEEGDRAVDAGAARGRPREDRPAPARRSEVTQRRGPRPGRRRGAGGRRAARARSGSSTDERSGPRPRRARRRRAGPAARSRRWRSPGGSPTALGGPLEALSSSVPAAGRAAPARSAARASTTAHVVDAPGLTLDYAPTAWAASRRPGRRAARRRRPSSALGTRARQRGPRPRRRPARPADGGELPRGRARRAVAASTRQRWAGSLLEDCCARRARPAPDRRAEHASPVEAADAGAGAGRRGVRADADRRGSRASASTGREAPERGRISLADARVVVGGGRGVGSSEGFAELEELAGLLGGAVGGSRVVTSAGWRPHSDQIGQTGPADRAGPLHRLRDQRRDPAHRRLQGGQAHPRDQHRRRGADHGRRRLRGDRRPPRGRAGDHRRDPAGHGPLAGLNADKERPAGLTPDRPRPIPAGRGRLVAEVEPGLDGGGPTEPSSRRMIRPANACHGARRRPRVQPLLCSL